MRKETTSPRILLSGTVTTVIEGMLAIALYEWLGGEIKGTEFEQWLSQHTWTKPAILLVGFVVLFPLLDWIIRRGPLKRLRRAIAVGVIRAWAELRGRPRTTIFDVAERTGDSFQEMLIGHLAKSHKIYFRLISGDTMFHDPVEQFILETLDLPQTENTPNCDRRVQLLDRSTEEFRTRAQWFVHENLDQHRAGRPLVSLDHYIHACEDNERTFRQRGFRIFRYRSHPNWRLHIFDDAAFVSSYGDREEGHRTPCIMIPREAKRDRPNPLYSLLLAEFERCCNEDREVLDGLQSEMAITESSNKRKEPPGDA